MSDFWRILGLAPYPVLKTEVPLKRQSFDAIILRHFMKNEDKKPVVNVVKKDEPKKQCSCDFTAYCPVHSVNGKPAYKFDPNSYIAQG